MVVEVLFLCALDAAFAMHGSEIAQHDGEGLLRAVFALAQLLYGGFVFCIAGEMEAADALDGDDAARLQYTSCACDRGMIFFRTA